MSQRKGSFLRRILSPIPIPVLALILGLSAGLSVWFLLDQVQSRALAELFEKELKQQLDQSARESLGRFDNFLRSYTAVTTLLANHRRVAEYLEPIIWFYSDDNIAQYEVNAPAWLPDPSIWKVTIQPSHVLLTDTAGVIREKYRLYGKNWSKTLIQDSLQGLTTEKNKSYLTKFGDDLYLLVSEPVKDISYNLMGALVLLVPVDNNFLRATQQRIERSNSIVALIEPESQQILTSSDEDMLPVDISLESIEDEFVVTAQSFFEYGDSELNLLFATLVPRQGVEDTVTRILNIERRQRLMGAIVIIVSFVLLFILVSSRINRMLRRATVFSRKALHFEQPAPKKGNQLLILEDWIRDFIELVRMAREEMQTHYETEVKESRALQTAIMNTSLDPIITIDQRGRVIDFNPVASEVFGYQREQLIGQPIAELVLAPGSKTAFGLELKAGSNVNNALLGRRILIARDADHQEFPVEVAIKSTTLDDRLVYTVYFHDISELRRQAQEIESLAALVSESPIPVLKISPKGVILYANQASNPLLAYWECSRQQTLPIYWVQQIQAVVSSGVNKELEIQTGSHIFWLLLAPVASQEYINIYARDISRIRWAEEEVKRRQNELVHVSRLSTMGEMATGIAHELNQPLSAIANFSNGSIRRLSNGWNNPLELADTLKQIAKQANRAGEIIKRLRGMVSRQAIDRQFININLLIKEVLSMVEHDRRKYKVSIETYFSEGIPELKLDAVQIEQVILNLVRNSFDAMQALTDQKNTLKITTGFTENSSIYIEICDTGSGMSEEVKMHLFDPFYTTKSTGMGMGLSISQTIIEEHNGKISVASKPSEGSCFLLEFPLTLSNEQPLMESVS